MDLEEMADQEILKAFRKSKSKRRKFAERIHKEILKKAPVSYAMISALETLLSGCPHRGIFFDGSGEMNPTYQKNEDIYYVNFSYDYKKFRLEKSPQRALFEFDESGKKINIKIEYGEEYDVGIRHLELKPKNGYFGYKKLSQEKISRYCGVGMHTFRPTEIRRISIAAKTLRFHQDNRGTKIIFVFNKGERFYFNLYGEQMFLSGGSKKTIQERKRLKMLPIKRQFNDFNREQHIEYVKSLILKNWQECPEFFERSKYFLISGEGRRICDGKGWVNIGYTNIEDKKTKPRVHCQTSLAKAKVKIIARGICYMIYNDDRLVNAHNLEDVCFNEMPFDGEFLACRKISAGSRINISAGPHSYTFFPENLPNIAEPAAIQTHYIPSYQPSFTLLHGEGNEQIPIRPRWRNKLYKRQEIVLK